MCGNDCECPIECSTPVGMFEKIAVLKDNQYQQTDEKKYFVLMYRPPNGTCDDDILPGVFSLVECDNDSLISLDVDETLKSELINNNGGLICVDVNPVLNKINLLNHESTGQKIKEHRECECDDFYMGDDCTPTKCTDEQIISCMNKNQEQQR